MTESPTNILTGVDYETEADAWAAFDAAMLRAKAMFSTYKEVRGELLQPRPGADDNGVRIDRILIPTLAGRSAGWKFGVIGVEAKRSNEKVGRPLSQCLDYSRAAFDIGDRILVVPTWIFLFPMQRVTGDLESIMAQQRIGYVWSSNRCPLIFGCGGMNVLGINHDGTIEAKAPPMGNKTGNRG